MDPIFVTSDQWNAIVDAGTAIPFGRYIFGEGPGDYREYQWRPDSNNQFSLIDMGSYTETAGLL